jgi:hypothetical protein
MPLRIVHPSGSLLAPITQTRAAGVMESTTETMQRGEMP